MAASSSSAVSTTITAAVKRQRLSAGISVPDDWRRAANELVFDVWDVDAPPVVVVCGPKDTGKSTFSRYLINVLLKRYKKVAYLETDVGQPEYTPPGCLSLSLHDKENLDLAVPCLKTPQRCYFFGDISSERDTSTYLNLTYALYDYYRKEYNYHRADNFGESAVPLIVNTPGCAEGIRYDTLVHMLKKLSPSYVVKTAIPGSSGNLPCGAFWLGNDVDDDAGDVIVLDIYSPCRNMLKRSALVPHDEELHRDLRLMGYFRLFLPTDVNISTEKDFASALAAHPPYEVPMKLVRIKRLHDKVPDSEDYYGLKGYIVGLAVKSRASDGPPRCVGLGIIRDINNDKKVIYLITPVPHVMGDVRLLLQGLIKVPHYLMTDMYGKDVAASIPLIY